MLLQPSVAPPSPVGARIARPFIPDVILTLRAGARRVIGATAKPLYAIDGKAVGLDRRIPQDLPPRGRGTAAAVEGVRASRARRHSANSRFPLPQTSLFEGGGPPAGGGRSTQAVEGVRRRWKELRKAFSKLHMLHMHHMPDTHQAYDIFSLFLSYCVLFPQTQPSKQPFSRQPFSVK